MYFNSASGANRNVIV